MSHKGYAIRRSVVNRCLIAVFATAAALLGTDRPAHGQCEAAQLTAPGGDGGNDFARGVAIDGEVAVVGDPVIEAVYVFRRCGSGPGDWLLEQVLTPPDGEVADQFGRVAIDGEVILVGAPGAAVPEFGRGAGYVYRYDPQARQWRFEQQLLASDGEAGDKFGQSVSIDGDLIVMGAPFKDSDPQVDDGAAYLFRYDPDGSGQWVEQEKLTDPDGKMNDGFGWTVSLRGDVALIGAHGNDDAGLGTGAAFIFRRAPKDPGQWNLEEQLTAFDADLGDHFGWSVSLADDAALIGARDADQFGTAYVFRYDGRNWRREIKLIGSEPLGVAPKFGYSVSLSDDATRALIGAQGDNALGSTSGAAYFFRNKGTGWVETKKLLASDGAPQDILGTSVSMSGATGLVGAPRQSENPGTTYVFDLDPPLGDLDCDGAVGVTDLLIMLASWGPCESCIACPADLDRNCAVGASDLLLLLVNWG